MGAWKNVGRAVGVVAVFGFVSMASAQEGGPPRPTDEHKVLAADAGTWDAVVKSYLTGPDAEPMISKGTEVNTVMTGGLWVLSHFQGEFAGQPFEGRGQFGYDSLKKKYIGTWIDSMSPGLAVLEGSYDAKTRTLTYEGDGVDLTSKAKYHQRMVTTTKDDGTRVFSHFVKIAGADNEVKFMEITYTRKK